MTTLRFAELTWKEVAALRDGRPPVVLLLPVGATEPHGPHAPLETDVLISLGTCERAAAALADDPAVRALVLPALPFGVTRYGAAFAGAIGVGEDALHDLVVDLLASLGEQGFPRVVVVNNHFEPEHVATLQRAVATAAGRGSQPAYLDLLRSRTAALLGDEFASGSCHAGRYETSLVLADRPELVRAERMAALPALPVDMPSAIAAGRTDFGAMGMAEAYCGAPAEATAEEGEATFATLAGLLVDVVRGLA